MSPFVPPGLGYKSFLKIGREATYDTPPAAAEAVMEVVGMTITPRLSTIDDPSLSAGQESRRVIGQGGQYVEASFRVRLGYDGILTLLRMFYPVYSSAVVDTTARAHTFKETSVAVPNALSYTLDFMWGDVPAGKSNRITGCFGQNIRITGQAGTGENAMLFAECTIVGHILTPNSTPMTGSLSTATPIGIIYHQQLLTATSLRDGSGLASDSVQVTGFEFAHTKGYDTQRFLFGQLNAERPVRNAVTEVTWTFDEEWTDFALMQAMRNNTPTQLRMFFQHPTIIGMTTAKREFEITASSPTPAEYSTEVPGFGVITQRGAYKLAYNVTDASHAVIRVQTTEAAMAP